MLFSNKITLGRYHNDAVYISFTTDLIFYNFVSYFDFKKLIIALLK